MLFKKKENKKLDTENYGDQFEIKPLKMVVVIVNKYQGEYFVNLFVKKHGVSAAFLLNGRGTASDEIYDLLDISSNKKDVVFAIIDENKKEDILRDIDFRFKYSEGAKGIAFTTPLDSMIGVLLYRFFSNTKENIKKGE